MGKGMGMGMGMGKDGAREAVALDAGQAAGGVAVAEAGGGQRAGLLFGAALGRGVRGGAVAVAAVAEGVAGGQHRGDGLGDLDDAGAVDDLGCGGLVDLVDDDVLLVVFGVELDVVEFLDFVVELLVLLVKLLVLVVKLALTGLGVHLLVIPDLDGITQRAAEGFRGNFPQWCSFLDVRFRYIR
ncbi:hypothetical protein OPT61_g7341 [Boeremia exigua]|uniref:Uncharacterized protein n=1 Tax=Boeremia exigua TaxID=749465 RepID=A0ACC2I4C6_9PLEO|nr:hypothetical protein OPT61_g7341 [Boeremia exigua]